MCDLLKNQYDRPEQIIFTHVQDLLNLPIPAKCSVKQLWQLNDQLLAQVMSLESLEGERNTMRCYFDFCDCLVFAGGYLY